MKRRVGVNLLLIMCEIVLLAAVVVLGVVKALGGGVNRNASVVTELSTENAIHFDTEAVSAEENTETEAAAQMAASGTDDFSEEVWQQLSTMTVEQKVAQMFLVSPETLTGNETVTIAGEGTRSALAEYPVGGLVYSQKNVQGRQQFGALLAGAQSYSVAQSGSYLILAAKGEDGTIYISDVYDTGALTEAMLSDFAEEEMEHVRAVEELAAEEDASFLFYSYGGLTLTSDLAATEITSAYPDGEAAVLAIEAGADVLLITEDFKTAYEAVLAAVDEQRITEDALNRAVGHILSRKEEMPAPQDGDLTSDNTNSSGNARTTNTAGNENASGNNTAGDTDAAGASNTSDGSVADSNSVDYSNNADSTDYTADTGSAADTTSTTDATHADNSGSTDDTASTNAAGATDTTGNTDTTGTTDTTGNTGTTGTTDTTGNTGTTGTTDTTGNTDATGATDTTGNTDTTGATDTTGNTDDAGATDTTDADTGNDSSNNSAE